MRAPVHCEQCRQIRLHCVLCIPCDRILCRRCCRQHLCIRTDYQITLL